MAASALEEHLGYWLRFVSNHVSQGFSRKLAARDVTAAEWVVMRDLFDRDRAIPSALAARIGLTRGAVSKLADRLIDKGLVARRIADDDRRYQALALTAQGRALVPKLAALADRNDAEFFGHLSRTDRARLAGMLKDIARRHDMRSIPVD